MEWPQKVAIAATGTTIVGFLYKTIAGGVRTLVDAWWKRVWVRNREFVAMELEDMLEEKLKPLEGLAPLAASLETLATQLSEYTKAQSRATRQIRKTQNKHGIMIASMTTSIEFLRELPVRRDPHV